MTPEQLAEIKARLAAITAGKWVADAKRRDLLVIHADGLFVCDGLTPHDAAFIVSAPATIDALIAEVERLRAENDAMRHDLHVTDGLYAMDKPIAHDDAFRIEHRSLHSVSA